MWSKRGQLKTQEPAEHGLQNKAQVGYFFLKEEKAEVHHKQCIE
jgi:hypothetical protein